MSDYGAIFYTETGYTQIDDKTPCLSLLQKTTFNSSNFGNGYGSITVTGTNPILAIRPTNISAGILDMSKNGSQFTWRISRFNSPRTSGSNWSIDCYVFDYPPQTVSNNWGLEIRNDSNQIMFTSDRMPLMVAGSGVNTYSAGRQYAFHQSRVKIERGDEIWIDREIDDSAGNPVWIPEFAGYEHIPSGWEVINNQVLAVDQVSNDYWITPPVFMVVDVTNI